MTTQEKIYLPLIQSFKTENIDLYKNNLWIKPAVQTDFSGLFIPHYISKEYESLEKKIFFGFLLPMFLICLKVII